MAFVLPQLETEHKMELAVYLFDEHIGILRTTENQGLSFTYTKDYRNKTNALPLSLSLPLGEESFNQKECLPYFIGLLPEGEVKKKIAQALHISELSTIKFLEALGGECAGSVSFYGLNKSENIAVEYHSEQDKGAHTNNKQLTKSWSLTNDYYTALSNEEIYTLIQNIHIRPLIQGTKDVRLSLAGAQEKFSLAYIRDAWHLPKYGAPSTHIIKPSVKGSFDYIAENEFFCMQLAKAFELDVPNHTLLQIGDAFIFVIERYDRLFLAQEQKIERIHQEDFCQALRIMSDSKYQNDGGPSIPDCVELIKNNLTNPIQDMSKFLKAIVFNYVIGNCDAHGKNFSLLIKDSSVTLAPLYDLVSTTLYPALNTKMAMKIGTNYDIMQVTKSNFIKLAELCDIKPRIFFDTLESYSVAIDEKYDSILQNPILDHCKDFLLPLRSQMQTRIKNILGT